MKPRYGIVLPAGGEIIRVVGSNKANRKRTGLHKLSSATTFIHIHGCPFLWAIEAILRKAPNLKTIQTIPSARDYIGPRSLRMLEERGVSITTGHAFPYLAWKRRGNRKPSYAKQQKMLLSLDSESKKLLDELCSLKIREALVARRYFCLDGDQFISQSQLAKKLGLSDKKNDATAVSICIHAVMMYLGKRTSTSAAVSRRAGWIRKKVALIRRNEMIAIVQSMEAASRDEFMRSFGLPHLPTSLPPGKMKTLGGILACFSNGKLDRLAKAEPRMHMILLHRFGLERWQDRRVIGSCRTLKTLGLMFGRISRERIRQLERDALVILGIKG